MDEATVQRLQDLPADLRERGWQLSLVESAVEGRTPPWHRAVYSRLFVDRLDRHDRSWPVYDKRTRRQILRISTHQDRNPTWEDARQDAIRRMREVDARVRDAT